MSLATSMMLSVQIARVARGNRFRKSPDQPRLPTDVLSAAWCAGGAGRRVISERPDRIAEIHGNVVRALAQGASLLDEACVLDPKHNLRLIQPGYGKRRPEHRRHCNQKPGSHGISTVKEPKGRSS